MLEVRPLAQCGSVELIAKSGSADAVRSDPSRWALWGQGVQLCAAMSQQLPVSAKL